jgi:hypothetical protein
VATTHTGGWCCCSAHATVQMGCVMPIPSCFVLHLADADAAAFAATAAAAGVHRCLGLVSLAVTSILGSGTRQQEWARAKCGWDLSCCLEGAHSSLPWCTACGRTPQARSRRRCVVCDGAQGLGLCVVCCLVGAYSTLPWYV